MVNNDFKVAVYDENWKIRVKTITAKFETLFPASVEKEARRLHYAILNYTKGPIFPDGQPFTVPIRRISWALYKSVLNGLVKENSLLYYVGSRGEIAPHNVYVHYGTKRMEPRPFVAGPAEKLSREMIDNWGKAFKECLI